MAEGTPHERGLHIGREISDLIQDSMEFYHRYFDRRGVSSPHLQELLTPHMVAAERAMPDLMEVLKGMSEGALVPFTELFAVNAFEELEPLLEPVDGVPLFLAQKEGTPIPAPTVPASRAATVDRCTAFSLITDDATIVAHNEHWLAGDINNVAVIIERATPDGPWTASPTVAACLGASGMNSGGAAVGIQSLTASDDRAGIPRVLVSRGALEADSPSEALRRTGIGQRAGGYGYVYAFAREASSALRIESTADRQVSFDGTGAHTNHYLDPALAQMAPTPSASSQGRYDAITAALAERDPKSPEDAMAILREVDFTPPESAYTVQDAADERDVIVFSLVAELRSGRLWVAPGDPKTTPYEEVSLPDAA